MVRIRKADQRSDKTGVGFHPPRFEKCIAGGSGLQLPRTIFTQNVFYRAFDMTSTIGVPLNEAAFVISGSPSASSCQEQLLRQHTGGVDRDAG